MKKLPSRIVALLGVFLLALAFSASLASADPGATDSAAAQVQKPDEPSPGGDLIPRFLLAVHSEAFYDPAHSPNCTWICSSGATGSATATSDSNCGQRCRTACGNLCVY